MTSSKLSALCDGIIEAGWLFAAVITPLFINVYSSRNIEPDKIAVLRVIVGVMIAAWLVKWIDRHRASPVSRAMWLRAPFVAPALALVGVNLIATFTSLAPRISLFGEYVRPEGLHTLLAYALVFLLLGQGLRSRSQLDRLIAAIVLTSLPIALYGLLQKLQLDPISWSQDMNGRVGSTLGDPIFLGAYLIMVFMLTLGVLINTVHQPRKPIVRLIGLTLIAFTQAAAIVFTVSRGPWVGGLVGLFLFVLLLALASRRKRLIWSVIGLSVAGAVFIAVLNLPNTPLSSIRSLPTIGALGHLFEGETGTGQVRTLIGQGNAQLIFQRTPIQYPDGSVDRLDALRPFVGYGPDTMYLAFSQVAPPQLATLQGQATLSDRSHNETWDTLINTGAIGLVAYQWLWLSVAVFALRTIGLMTSQRQHNLFIGLWIGLGLAGGAAAVALHQAKYFGLALPIGNVIGLIVYLVIQTVASMRSNQPAELHADQILLMALFAGLMAHYIETQFGLAVASTRITFWIFVAVLAVIGSKRIVVEEPAEGSTRSSIGYALIAAAILVTLLYGFVTRNFGMTDPFNILLGALTFDVVKQTTSLAIAALLVVTWLAASVFILTEVRQPRLVPIMAVSLGLPVAFSLGLTARLGVLINVPAPIKQANAVMTLGSQLTGLFDYYIVSVIGLTALLALAFRFELKPTASRWVNSRWSAITFAPIAAMLLLWINAVNLNPIRADVFYKLGQEYANAPDVAVVLHKQAVVLAPHEDFYYAAWGDAFRKKANRSDPDAGSIFGDTTQVSDVMALDQDRTIGLGRADSLYAALLMLWRARDLDPLFGDHTLNLARFLLPDLPADTDARRELAQRANDYYRQASRLRPLNVTIWNEWADFDLTYENDADGALAKLAEAARLDPAFPDTYMTTGQAYAAKKDLERAAEAYRHAIDLKPDLAEAHSKLAFVYYQQGNLSSAIESFEEYVVLAPNAANVWEAHKNLALLYKQLGDKARALDEAQRAARLAPAESKSQLNDFVATLQSE